jgi:predicted DCC family thiol-disulfide oxidoreductase YuxK
LIEYAPFQELRPEVRETYGMSVQDFQGQMHYISQNGSVVSGSVAIAEVCRLLTPFSFICGFFSTPFAIKVYDFIARRRYGLFGCSNLCYVVGVRGAARIKRT